MSRHRPDPLAGETIVITGAASGIGRALARRMSAAGSPVALADIDEAGLKQTAASLRGPVLTAVVDVRDAQAVTAFAASVSDWMPRRIGAVFNNAGVAVIASVLDAAVEDDEWLHSINFHGVIHVARAFLPILARADHGALVNISSVFGLVGMPYQSAYCAAKFAVRGFTESLRHELRGTGVRAITVHPGGIKTNIVTNARAIRDPLGLDRTKQEVAAEFEAIARTTPDRAAEIIHKGVDAGKSRILVGPDAYFFDALARIAPTRYYDVIARLEPRLRPRPADRTTPPPAPGTVSAETAITETRALKGERS